MDCMDDRNRAILAERQARLDAREQPGVGDYIEFANGVIRRISYVWLWEEEEAIRKWTASEYQTSAGGSFYLGENGYVSFSGSLYASIPGTTLKPTGGRRPGSVWFFKDGYACAGGGLDTQAEFRVYSSSAEAPQ